MEILDRYNDLLYIHISEIFKSKSKKDLYQYFYDNKEKVILIDNSDEPDFIYQIKNVIFWNEIDKLFPNKNCFILTMGFDSDGPLKFENIQIIKFDLAHLFITKQIFDDISYKSEISLKKDMKFLKCLNYKPHPHRIKMMDELHKKDLVKGNLVTWNMTTDEYKKNDIHLNLPEFKFWHEKKINNQENFKQKSAFDNKSNFFDNNNFINLVAETKSNNTVITEKTFGAIFNNEIFISYGIPGIHDKLKKLGFLLYDEIIDYNFDFIDNITESITDIVNQLSNLKKLDYLSTKSRLKEKILYNSHHADKLSRDIKSIPNLLRHLFYNYEHSFQKSKLGYTLRATFELYKNDK